MNCSRGETSRAEPRSQTLFLSPPSYSSSPSPAIRGPDRVLLAEEDDRAYACIPIRSVWKWRGFPYPFVTTETSRTLECGTPLVDIERGAEGLATILSALLERRQIVARDSRPPAHHSDRARVRSTSNGHPDIQSPLHRVRELGARLSERRHEPHYEQLINANCVEASAAEPADRREVRNRTGLVDRTADPEPSISSSASRSQVQGVAGLAMTTHAGEPEFFAAICRGFVGRRSPSSALARSWRRDVGHVRLASRW